LVDSVLWLEQYPDICSWAAAEMFAQRSEEWMALVAGSESGDSTKTGTSEVIVDDSLGEIRSLNEAPVTVEWQVFSPSKMDALTEMPKLADEFNGLLNEAGFDCAGIRYFAMPTSSGNNQNHAHFWMECRTAAELLDILSWKQRSPELADWRTRLRSVGAELLSSHLLQQVAV